MKIKFGLTLFLSFIVIGHLFSQNPTYAIHLSNPIGFLNKVGAKFELKTNRMGFLLCANNYFDIIVPHYPGVQLGLEWRAYSANDSNKKNDTFYYTKLIGGHQNFRHQSGDGFTNIREVPEGYYYGLGVGVGKQYNFNHYFIELNGGLKGVLSTVNQEPAFYITGPASFLDLHLNFGYQF